MPQSEWATCMECGWHGLVDNVITICPICGQTIGVSRG